MSAGVVDQKQRLAAARKALMRAESRQDMRSVSSSVEGGVAGVYHLDGSVQGLAEGLAGVLGADQYAAVVGVDDVSWEGVSALGVDVSRVVVVRNGGGGKGLADQGMKVVASLVEGFSVVVVGEVEMAPRHQRALAGRARKLGATILTMQPWIGVSVGLTHLEGEGVGGAQNPLLAYRRRGA